MTGTKLPLHQIKHAFATTSALVSLVSYPASVLAQPVASTSNSSDKIPISFNQQAEDGSSRGRPSRREGTGSRGDCPPVEIPLTALVPAGNVGLTLEKHPTFWFYVPYSPGDTASGEFVLQDEANNDVYRTSLTLPREPGVVSFSLPSATPLEMNKTYQWYFKLYCGETMNRASIKSSTPVFVRGWVKRMPLVPDLEGLLKAATTPRKRIAVYAQNGIWHEAVTELAKLRLTEPQNSTLNSDWTTLLSDVGLEKVAGEPIIGSVSGN